VGLAFFEASLRTRVGFAAASARLGMVPIEIASVRSSPISMAESVKDTLRVFAGYSDIIVTRLSEPFPAAERLAVPLLNAGDRGPDAEHPSQALIDLFALQESFGSVDLLTIALCGDLRMRAARSLLLLLSQRRPKRLLLITEAPLTYGFVLPGDLADITEFRTLDDLTDVEVLYVVGIPYGALEESGRQRLRITRRSINSLPSNAVVLSPLPVIDELERDALTHPSVRVFQQSDDGLFVRMAILEFLLSPTSIG
jgi:aspartate carbamoyltransferase catalytic subunit